MSGYSQLCHQAISVGLNSLSGNVQAFCRLGTGTSQCRQIQHLKLPISQAPHRAAANLPEDTCVFELKFSHTLTEIEPAGHDGLNGTPELGLRIVLQYVTKHARPARTDEVPGGLANSNNQYPRRRQSRKDPARGFQSAGVRQQNIHCDDVRPEAQCGTQSFGTTRRGRDDLDSRQLFQQCRNSVTNDPVRVDHENASALEYRGAPEPARILSLLSCDHQNRQYNPTV